MQGYLDKIYGKKERYSDTVKKQKKPVAMKKVEVPEIKEEEIFVEYDNAKSTGVRGWLQSVFSPSRREDADLDLDDLPETESKVLEEIEEDIELIDEEIEELEEVREGLVTRFLKSMRIGRSRKKSPAEIKEDLLDETVASIDSDVKETLKTMHKWLEKLPNQELRAFKTSKDFEQYVAVLQKYGLVKKEDEAVAEAVVEEEIKE